jgi:hypothetical protein
MTEAEAIARARETAEAKGWAWVEPTTSLFRRGWFGRAGKWEVSSNAKGLGARVRIVIDDATGKVARAGYIPR